MPPEWKQLLARSLSDPRALPDHLNRNAEELRQVADRYPMRINPYFLSLLTSPDDPLGRQAVPSRAELEDGHVPPDPLNEEAQSPVKGLIHRYPGRVAFMVSQTCAMNCRFCMRKRREVLDNRSGAALIQQGIDYIRNAAAVTEVILTGGDPLMLSDSRLHSLLEELSAIAHVRVLRLHTRMPIVLPQRVTRELAGMLASFQPFYLNVHVNHPAEITPQAVAACDRLADAGICLGSQTVLLKDVNDNADTLRDLFTGLLEIRVRPYYLHLLDGVRGSTHFQVPPETGLDLLKSLRGRISGMAVPHLMIDLPGGGGKVALTPETVVEKHATHWVLRNWEGKTFSYPIFRR